MSPENFFNELDRSFPRSTFLIAFSGGLDSTVLLHLCAAGAGAENLDRLLAVHVNHGLQPEAATWAMHCLKACESLGLRSRVLTVDGHPERGQSPEEAARLARYEALQSLVTDRSVVLVAQHLDDQAETILLQLLRGSGLKGLSGMPASTGFGAGVLHRPLLGVSRDSLRQYAERNGLTWLDDPSNQDTSYQRNYLRREIIPRLKSRWPGMAKTLARAGRHCADAQQMLNQQVNSWFDSVVVAERNTIRLEALSNFNRRQQKSILRYWIDCSGFRCPSEINLTRIIIESLNAASDRLPCIRWSAGEVRRYRGELYLLAPSDGFDPKKTIAWSLRTPLRIAELGGTLVCSIDSVSGVGHEWSEACIRFRTGGELCRLPGRKGSRCLKKVFQEQGVPPWERDRIPLVYIREELVAVAGLFVCEPFHGQGLSFNWTLDGRS